MKKIFVLSFILLVLSINCNSNQETNNKSVDATDAVKKVEVYYFHATHRCPTCLAIEAAVRKTLDTYFKKQMADKTVQFFVLNAEEDKNKALAEKYQAFGASLFVTKIVNGKETINDMTNFAFTNVKTSEEKFIAGLKDKINECLK